MTVNDENMIRRLVVVVGCTGTGKSKLGIELAKRFNGEVINADSMQVYQGLDILTNKVTTEEADGVEHHLLGYLPKNRTDYNARDYRLDAQRTLESIWARDRLPILVGGTVYYIASLLWNNLLDVELGTSSEASTSSRNPPDLEEKTDEELYRELSSIDPAQAAVTQPKSRRKVMHALHIYYQTGVRQSEHIARKRERTGAAEGGTLEIPQTCVLWTQCERETLNERLNDRVLAMMNAGGLNELQNYFEEFGLGNLPLGVEAEQEGGRTYELGALQNIGLKEFLPYLKIPHEDRSNENAQKIYNRCLAALQISTRQYARDQEKIIKLQFLRRPYRPSPPVYPLDSSDLTRWNEEVCDKAVSIVDSFLRNEYPDVDPIPVEPVVHDRRTIYYCECCDKHMQGDLQWAAHLKGKQHRHFSKKKEESSTHSRII